MNDEDIQAHIERRSDALKAGNVTDAGLIRGRLLREGVTLEDTSEGTKWRRVESANTRTLTIGEWQIDDFQHGVIPSIRLTAPFGSGCWTYYDVTDGPGHVIWCLLRMLIDEVPKLAPSTSNFTVLRNRLETLEQERRDLLLEIARTAQDGLKLAAAALQHGPTAEFEIHDNGEYFAATSGPREKAWAEAMRYVSHCEGTATVFEVVKREIKL